MAEVKVGDRTVTIPRFSGFKVVRAGRIVKELTRKYPSVLFDIASFTREYEERNSVRVTRAMAKLPRYEQIGLTDRDFGDKEFVEFPQSPSTPEQIAAVFPQIMEAAESEIVTLLALILAPNSELADHDEAGDVDEYLSKEGKKLLHSADADQLVDVALVAVDVLRDQFAKKIDEVGKLRALVDPQAAATAARQAKKENSPESSTDSDAPTDGATDTQRTASVGVS